MTMNGDGLAHRSYAQVHSTHTHTRSQTASHWIFRPTRNPLPTRCRPSTCIFQCCCCPV